MGRRKGTYLGRPRGGASFPCVVCGSPTRVLSTRKKDIPVRGTDETLQISIARYRQCTNAECLHPTKTYEVGDWVFPKSSLHPNPNLDRDLNISENDLVE